MLALRKNSLAPTVSRFLNDDWATLFDWSDHGFINSPSSIPAVNITENDNEFNVEVAAPGMKRDDFIIELNNGVLSIESQKNQENEETTDQNYTRKEFAYMSFKRTFTLAEDLIDEDKISAKYEDGLLKIVLPKKEEARPKPAKRIEIL